MRILYVDIDTLRADHLGCAGYHRDTTPNIDALAAEGVRFEQVYASDVPCLPSRTALATGEFGTRNGVVTHGGVAADLRPDGARRPFMSGRMTRSWAWRLYQAGYHTASISSFPFRHSAAWWNHGFMEALNLMRGMGAERADQVLPGALDWLDRRGADDRWFLHVHLWDPHTPYNTPDDYGNPFASDPIPEWHTEAVRARNWDLPGPHSAREPWGFRPDEWGPPPSRQPWDAADLDAVKGIFDGYDVGVRYADDAVGALVDRLASLGVLEETAILIGSDHGESFGELGVYADHQTADEPVAHVPAVLRWPGLEPRVQPGLHYHLDVAATVVELAGGTVPDSWDGTSLAPALRDGADAGRDHLVLTQGAWTCQRGVRTGDHLYLRTWHDGYHAWPDEMLFDVAADPHQTVDLAEDPAHADTLVAARSTLADWTDDQLARSGLADPLATVVGEGGPYHTRGHLPAYLDRLRATGRGHWADALAARHPSEADPDRWAEHRAGHRDLLAALMAGHAR
ncbi:MAG: sulfatase [Acidimicrobiales bacterium]|nr:sulfatase [Acidimicrobiales bacterium]